MRTIRPKCQFAVVLEFPVAPSKVVVGRDVGIYLASNQRETAGQPGIQITTCGAFQLHVAGEGIAWVELELYADDKGNPLFDGNPMFNNVGIITKVFAADVTEIRSAPSYNRGYKDAHAHLNARVNTNDMAQSRKKSRS